MCENVTKRSKGGIEMNFMNVSGQEKMMEKNHKSWGMFKKNKKWKGCGVDGITGESTFRYVFLLKLLCLLFSSECEDYIVACWLVERFVVGKICNKWIYKNYVMLSMPQKCLVEFWKWKYTEDQAGDEQTRVLLFNKSLTFRFFWYRESIL